MTEPTQWTVLCAGYVGDRVASTVTYVCDGDSRIIINPGMGASRDLILARWPVSGWPRMRSPTSSSATTIRTTR